mmetsp:Transcript_61168/g.117933  ORF Transcript_61168/g.117933 Transcript_61168/m.117933 type:complete len:212 (+) Transcript_61168:106-741(+)
MHLFTQRRRQRTEQRTHALQKRGSPKNVKIASGLSYIPFPSIATASSLATSCSVSLQPSAPALSTACARVRAPGIGTVPLQMHQLMATCATVLSRAFAMAWVSRSTATVGPCVMLPTLSFSVRRPLAKGAHARTVMPRSLHVRSRPKLSAERSKSENSISLKMSGTPRASNRPWNSRSWASPKFETPTLCARPCCCASASCSASSFNSPLG